MGIQEDYVEEKCLETSKILQLRQLSGCSLYEARLALSYCDSIELATAWLKFYGCAVFIKPKDGETREAESLRWVIAKAEELLNEKIFIFLILSIVTNFYYWNYSYAVQSKVYTTKVINKRLISLNPIIAEIDYKLDNGLQYTRPVYYEEYELLKIGQNDTVKLINLEVEGNLFDRLLWFIMIISVAITAIAIIFCLISIWL